MKVTRDEAKEIIKEKGNLLDYAESRLQRDKKSHGTGKAREKVGYVCPHCGNGTGKNGDGMHYFKEGNCFKCFSCDRNFDTFALIQEQEGISDFNEALKYGCDFFSLELVGSHSSKQEEHAAREAIRQARERSAEASEEKDEQVSYESYIKEAAARVEQAGAYLQSRGISIETARRYGVGFDAAFVHPEVLKKIEEAKREGKRVPKKFPAPRLIIPFDNFKGYLARRTDGLEGKENYPKLHAGSTRCFNPGILEKETRPVFIVEGAIDALSIIEVGGRAIGLNGKGKAREFAERLKGKKVKAPVVVALDADGKTKEETEILLRALRDRNVPTVVLDNFLGCKDANEALQKDRSAFEALVRSAEAAAFGKTAVGEELQRGRLDTLVESIMFNIKNGLGPKPIPTGFSQMDDILLGGLYNGLYTVGAVTGLGKTTFLLQMAYQIAEAGYPVHYYSLEVDAEIMAAKTLSRLMAEESERRQHNCAHVLARTALPILRGEFTQEQGEVLEAAAQRARQVRQKLAFLYGRYTAQRIADNVRSYIRLTGQKPVVVVDYLQILAHDTTKRLSDLQETDENVGIFMNLAHDCKIPVFLITSYPKSAANLPADIGAAKGSNSISYGSDVEIGLQYGAWEYREGDKENGGQARNVRLSKERDIIKEAAKNPGKPITITAKINKSRLSGGGKIEFDVYPMFSLYKERKIEPLYSEDAAREREEMQKFLECFDADYD